MRIDKNILSQIKSIRSELEDLRERLKKIENKKLKVVTDSVKGSSSTYPYIQHNCVIEGVEYPKNRHTRNKYRRLIKNKEYKLEKLINELEYNLNYEVCSKCENKLNDKDLCNIRINISGNANCVNYKEKSIVLNKWNYEKHKYEKYCVPSEWNVKIYTGNIEEIINCAHCGRKIKAGDSNTSCEIHNEVGIGYG